MDVSERVTWEHCPICGRPAAVGWLGKAPMEFDCPAGCWLSVKQIGAFTDGGGVRPAWPGRANW